MEFASKKKRILVDMDGCLVFLHGPWQNRLNELYPGKNIDFSLIKESITDECYELWGITEDQCTIPFYEQGFWENLPVQDDALDYFHKITKMYDVVITTKAHFNSPYCAYEKYLWVQKHLGKQEIIMTKQKSYVHANYIIDDMIENLEMCSTFMTPICYTQKWNQNWKGFRVFNWKQIYDFLLEEFHKTKVLSI